MAHSTRMIGQVFRDELAKKIATLPIFLRPQLAPILGLLLDWTEFVEGRLKTLDDFPLLPETPAVVLGPGLTLCAPAETATAAAARIQAEIDRCGGACDE